MPVDVRVADVDVVFRAELGFDLIEPMLEHRERDRDAVLLPHALLLAHGPVRATADDVAQRERLANALDGDAAGRVSGLQSPVDVEADELWQFASSLFC